MTKGRRSIPKLGGALRETKLKSLYRKANKFSEPGTPEELFRLMGYQFKPGELHKNKIIEELKK